MKIRIVVVAGVALLALSGCASAGASAGTTTPSATTVETSSPTPASEPEPASVVIGADSIEVLAGDGSLVASSDYYTSPEPIVAALAEVFGAAPLDSRERAGGDTPARTLHDWGTFRLTDYDDDGWGVPFAGFTVSSEAAVVSGVHVATTDGVTIGDDAAAVAQRFPSDVRQYPDPDSGSAEFDPSTGSLWVGISVVALPPSPTFDGQDLTFSVTAIADPASGPVTRILAPLANFGA